MGRMKKRFAALLLMLMMVLQILLPAYAREETPIPFSIMALQADEEKILVLDGLYLDSRFYAMASDMSELLRGTQAYKESRSFSFTAHGKSRRFRAEMEKKTLLECNALTEGKWQIDTLVPVLFVDGICYVSLGEQAYFSFDQRDGIGGDRAGQRQRLCPHLLYAAGRLHTGAGKVSGRSASIISGMPEENRNEIHFCPRFFQGVAQRRSHDGNSMQGRAAAFSGLSVRVHAHGGWRRGHGGGSGNRLRRTL